MKMQYLGFPKKVPAGERRPVLISNYRQGRIPAEITSQAIPVENCMDYGRVAIAFKSMALA